MKKLCSTTLFLLPFLLTSFLFTACSDDKEKLNYFKTEQFTMDSLFSAIKKYGEKKKYSEEFTYLLSENQAIAAYDNISIKQLMTSKIYDSKPKDISLESLWKVMYVDIFANNHSYTLDGLFNIVSEKCIWSSSEVSCVYFIAQAEQFMSKNNSIIKLCKDYGYEVFSTLHNENFELYKSDLIDLFLATNSWDYNNANIAQYYPFYGGCYYPFAFDASFWGSPNWKYEGNGYSFSDSTAYRNMVECIKSRLKDPDSYLENGNVEFYSTAGTPVRNGYYKGKVYARVPFRAKNSFGGYGTDVAWLTYDWNNHTFSWYSSAIPSNINDHSFETGFVH